MGVWYLKTGTYYCLRAYHLEGPYVVKQQKKSTPAALWQAACLGFHIRWRTSTKHLLRTNRLISRLRVDPPLSGLGARSRIGASLQLVGDRTSSPRPEERLLSLTDAAKRACSALETVTWPHAVPVNKACTNNTSYFVSVSGDAQYWLKCAAMAKKYKYNSEI